MESSVLILLVVAPIYLIPLILAKRRRHKFEGAIGLINVFFGWTMVGWVLALALASSGYDRSRMKQCGACRELFLTFAMTCPYCGAGRRTLRL